MTLEFKSLTPLTSLDRRSGNRCDLQPTANNMHVDWTLAAAQAGKHVLCEKPIGLNARDAERLQDCPKNVQVAEAFMVRYHPQWIRVREMVRSGELGEVRAIQATFSYFNNDGQDIRNRPEAGGWCDHGYRLLPDHSRAVFI